MPERMCINLMGDGAFGMSGLDIETAARTSGCGRIRVAAPAEMAPALNQAHRLNAYGKTVVIDVKIRAEHFRGPNIYGDLLGTIGNT